MFQQGALFSSLTVLQNIQVPMREYLKLSQGLIDELAMLKLDLVGLQPDAADKFPSELSGGMIKRAALPGRWRSIRRSSSSTSRHPGSIRSAPPSSTS